MERKNQLSLKFIILFILVLSSCYSQIKESSVMVNARAQKDKILVRWAINTPIEWKKAHKNGFIVNRFTVVRDGNVIAKPEKLILTPKPLLPEPLDSWMDLIQKDNYAAIIAQSIYGESFEVTGAKEGELSKIVNMAEELDQRYTFALYSADMSFEGALKAGWGIVDTNVKPNEVYVYQVSVFESPKVKTTSYMVGLKDFGPLPVPTEFMAVPDDKKILLSWNYETFKKIYSSFMVEKSSDGVNFEPISKTPLVNMNDKVDHPSKTMYYIDTLSVNDKTYKYRLYGITSFGEKGKVTDPIETKGVPAVVIAARLIDYHIQDVNNVSLEWEYPKEAEETIKGFEINLAEKDKGSYKVVSTGLLPTDRKFECNNLYLSNYFTVTVVGKNNQRLTSQSILVQPIDSIAPLKPVGLEGVIDSLGVVRLKWKANEERDLLGYRILKANNLDEEFVDIYHKSYVGNDYTDTTVSLKMTNKKVYYRIAAEDKRFNISELSEILILEKPDKIPPAAPVFKDFDVKDGKVFLKWIRSYSDDVVGYSLRRREKGQDKWEEIKQINDTLQEFIDNKIENRKTYQYAILAKDKSNLWSSLDHSTITVTALDFTPTKAISFIQGVADRENKKISLSWDYTKNKDKVVGLSIYKNTKGEAPTLWQELSGGVFILEDHDLKINTEYEYHLSPTLESSSPAKVESITVLY